MGKMRLNLYHTVWPSWVSSKKIEKVKHNEESSSWMLARSLSLRRANERAKTYQRSGGDDENGSQHRLSESIDALFVLSQLKEYGPDWFRYDDSYKREKELWVDDEKRDSSDYKGEKEIWIDDEKNDSSELEMKVNYHVDAKDLKLDNEEMEGHRGLENGGVKFEDKKIVSDVQEENESLSMDDRRTRRVADSLSACLPSEIFSTCVKESVALVKHSFNPYKDFRDSMMEMILASSVDFNNSDLEELLYCYFSLNSPEHHDLIRQAFMDIWLELQAV